MFDSDVMMQSLLPDFLEAGKLDTLIVATSGFCQARCSSCPWPFMTASKTLMDVDRFGQLLDKFAGFEIGKFAFNIINEPFTDRTVVEKIAMLARRRVRANVLFFSSNWLIPDERMVDAFVDAVAECANSETIPNLRLAATISGIDEASYDILQAGSELTGTVSKYRKLNFEKAVANVIAALQRLQDRVPAGKLIFWIKAYGHVFSQEEMTAFWNAKFAESGLRQDFLERCVKVVLNQGYTTFARGSHSLGDTPRRCVSRWLDTQLAIGPEGEIGLCCEDGMQQVVLGNIFDGSIRDVVESSVYQDYLAIVKGLQRPEPGSPCLKCQFFKPVKR